jgi:hypothetical protein
MAGKGREQARGFPRERREGGLVELRAMQPNQVGPIPLRRRAEDGGILIEPGRHGLPVHLVQAGAVAPHGNGALVPLREGIGDGVGEARPKVVAPLLCAVDFKDGQVAPLHGPPRVLVERLGDLLRLRVVPWHEPLIPPLPFRAVAEEQNGGLVAGRVDGGWRPMQNRRKDSNPWSSSNVSYHRCVLQTAAVTVVV